MEIKRIAVDTSKQVFTLFVVGDTGAGQWRELTRAKFLDFFRKLSAITVTLEACGASHHWGRELQALGHTVRLVPPQYVKPFVRRGKNDKKDAEAIDAAGERPGMVFVPVKAAATQADAMVPSVRELLVRQRTQLINALRGHAAEFGLITAKGTTKIEPLLALIAQASLPAMARDMLAALGAQIAHLDARIAALGAQLAKLHKANPVSQLLAKIPGVGEIGAITFALTVDPARFTSARHFAAWVGLTPREHSTGGRQRLGRITRAGNERLRQLLVVGATAVVRVAVQKPDSKIVSPWLRQLLARKPRKLAAVALANKIARILWAMMSSGEAYRGAPAPRQA